MNSPTVWRSVNEAKKILKMRIAQMLFFLDFVRFKNHLDATSTIISCLERLYEKKPFFGASHKKNTG